MFCVALPHGLGLIAELVEEEEPAEAVPADESGEADEGEGGDAAQGELRHRVVGPAVAIGAGEDKMGESGDHHGHPQENHPGEAGGPCVGLVHAQPFQPRPERLELVLGVRRRPLHPPLLLGGGAHQWPRSIRIVPHHFFGGKCNFLFGGSS